MHKTHQFLAVIFILGIHLNVYGQKPGSKRSVSFRLCFGGLSGGMISKYEHLEDSLAFTDTLANDYSRIVAFNIALACNGNVIQYFENKSGNKLTPEIKAAIRELHPGCSITFQGVRALDRQKDIHGKYNDINPGILKLTLKN